MDASLVVLLSLVVAAFAVALFRDPQLPLRGLEASGRLLHGCGSICFSASSSPASWTC